MSRCLPYVVNDNYGRKDENGDKSSSFGGKHNVNLDKNEDINAKESDDGICKDYYYYDDSNDYDDDDHHHHHHHHEGDHHDDDDHDDEEENDVEDDKKDEDDHDHEHDDDEEEEEEEEEKDDHDAHAAAADDDDIWISDCESSASVNKPNIDDSIDIQPEIRVDRLIRLNENDRLHVDVRNRLISAVDASGVKIQIEHIDMNVFKGNPISESRLQTFLSYKRAVEAKTGGYANVTRAWFVASKDQINHIILHGFSHESIQKNGGYGHGLYLSRDASVVESLKSSVVGDEGMRHILLCSVILGKLEVVKHGSKQCYPHSDEFQTGVDNLQSPKKYVVWSAYVNTHVLPEYVISFKTVSGFNEPIVGSGSTGMPISALFAGLSKILLPEVMKKIHEYYYLYIERKISRRDMLNGFKDSAGERFLWMAAKDYYDKKRLKRGNEEVNSSPFFK